MSEPRVLAHKQTALVAGAAGTKMGTLVLTDDRFTFMQTKFMGGATGGALGLALAEALQKRSEEGGPLLDVPLSAVTGFRREKKLLNKGRIAVDAGGQTYLFNDGWDEISAALRSVLAEQGKPVTEVNPETFEVS